MFARKKPKRWRYLRYAFLVFALLAASFTLYLDIRVRNEFEGRRFALPARIYARPLELHAGLRITAGGRHRRVARGRLPRRSAARASRAGLRERGRARDRGAAVRVLGRAAAGEAHPRRLRRQARSRRCRDAEGKDLPLARLEPLPIGGIYPANNEDRVLVRLDEVPKHLVQALIATEDRSFYTHHGFDLRGIARAALELRPRQGPAGRQHADAAAREELLPHPGAHAVGARSPSSSWRCCSSCTTDKNEILETYLNEIYLGQDRDRAIHGVGLAALHYFGKPVEQLTLAESALLVGMVKGPAVYDPYKHPDRALERRNLVLRETRDQRLSSRWSSTPSARAARLGAERQGRDGHLAPPGLPRSSCTGSCGATTTKPTCARRACAIFTTLDPRVQGAAERALDAQLAQFDKEKRFGDAGPRRRGGGHRHAVGRSAGAGRRARPALPRLQPRARRRAPGRLAARSPRSTSPRSPIRRATRWSRRIDDGPFAWKSRGAPDWQPANYDRKFHGMVPLRTALAQSYNAASARLGTDLGVERVLATVKQARHRARDAALRLDAARRGGPEPARGGADVPDHRERRLPHAAARDPRGDHAGRHGRSSAIRSRSSRRFPPSRCTSSPPRMQDVVREGTGAERSTNWLPPETGVAGKTGTTDEQRDAWFAGFTGDRARASCGSATTTTAPRASPAPAPRCRCGAR